MGTAPCVGVEISSLSPKHIQRNSADVAAGEARNGVSELTG